MRPFRIPYLILLSSIIGGCTAAYKHLQPADGNTDCVRELIPTFQKTWFTASIDVNKHHLSGLFLLKKMPDGSDRIVFTNELGVTFFDFEFSDTGFKVIQVIDKLNRKAVINTLKQDFELLLLKGLELNSVRRYRTTEGLYFDYPWADKLNYIVTSDDCSTLIRLERGSRKKKLVQIEFEGLLHPDKIKIRHFNFNMEIVLTKIDR